MFSDIVWIVVLTFVPTLELRAGIPFGIFKTDLHWSVVYMTAVIANILLGFIIYTLLEHTLHIFMRMKWFNKAYSWYHKRVQDKIHASVNKYGEFGLALFIGVPLPGSGSYSGAVAAQLLGMNKRQFFIANMIGVLIAATVILILCFVGGSAAQLLL